MKWIVRILGGLVALLVLCVLGLWLARMRLGRGHVVAVIVIDRSAPQVFRWLTDDDRVKMGDYTLAEENGKTRLRFAVQTKYSGFVLRLLEPMITPKAKEKLQEDFQRMKELAAAEPKTN